ncbi:MAG: hypothetical protein Kow0029_27200 [Candidatus Rifleibacteriota bacterium]
MKRTFYLLAVLLILFGYGQLLASCGVCDGNVKKDASCADGSCSITDSAKEHEHEGHDHASHSNKEEHKPATLNTPALKTLLDSGVPVILLDARSGKYDDGMRIPGAMSLNSESKAEEIAKVIPNKEALIVTYCSNLKCPASHKLYKHLKSLGYTNVIEYPEGIQGWKEAGNQVKSAK